MKKSLQKGRGFLALILLTVLFLESCGITKPENLSPRLVTGICVTYDSSGSRTEKRFTESHKMRAILNYLRWIDPYGAPEEDPEMISGTNFHITLQYSDGTEKNYRQKADRFMMEDNGRWEKIDPEKAVTLTKMLEEMESDGLA